MAISTDTEPDSDEARRLHAEVLNDIERARIAAQHKEGLAYTNGIYARTDSDRSEWAAFEPGSRSVCSSARLGL